MRVCRASQHHKAIFYNRKQCALWGPKLLCPSTLNKSPTFLQFDSHASPIDEVHHPTGHQVSPSFPNVDSCVIYNPCREGAPHLLPHLSNGLGERHDSGLLSNREEEHRQRVPFPHSRRTRADVLPTGQIEARWLAVKDPE